MPIRKKKIIVSVTNDLVSDNRVHKTVLSLISFGYDVFLIGRKLKKSLPVEREYKTKRFRLLFKKSVFFYAEYNFRLFFFLLFSKADIFLANDLDTLPANYLAARLKRKKIVYDSHEYFTEVPELLNRPRVKRIWEQIEKRILPKIKYSYTVCTSIADIYNRKYDINMQVVRNIPICTNNQDYSSPTLLTEIKDNKIILYQGAVNVGRGLEQLIDAMQFVKNAVLLIIGDGDIKNELELRVVKNKQEEQIIFTGKISFNELFAYTKQAHIGISIEEPIGLNYYYSLPNKLFDYIRAELPVLVSRLPETERIVNQYRVGMFIENHNPKHIAYKINTMLNSAEDYKTWKNNLKKAASEFCWENEENILKSLFS